MCSSYQLLLAPSTAFSIPVTPGALPGCHLLSKLLFMKSRLMSKALHNTHDCSPKCSQALVSNSAHQELTNDQGHCLNALDLLLGAHELSLEAALLLLDVLLLQGATVEGGLALGVARVAGYGSGSAQLIVSLQSRLNQALSCTVAASPETNPCIPC